METIGALIRKSRETRELSREKLAKRIGISVSYLSQLETNHVWLSPRLATVLVKKAGVSRRILGLREGHNRKVKKQRFAARENN